ncbi:family 43 glycosylhydrolase [Shewanella sp. 10N.7]|uniref:family 43 glycosylhydrolase n=1 Tax=Shewanella sp. 10N.7 TaxID=2885093 RepID=UPI001E2E7BCC|nr:family 43 glycosylhydrolase [Shewanella sp. 10N.7]MCC4831792.1 family 43 glycosylhydrolase [Shewanella sp. 10N.7]
MKIFQQLKKSNKGLKQAFYLSLISGLLIAGASVNAVENGNPLVDHIYTADPSAHVFEDRVYIYGSHDQDNAKGYKMIDYHVLSSADLVNWEDHGVALTVDDVPWADNRMWAPDAIFKDGTYYFYFPARQGKQFHIGVATSDSPAGPFIPEPDFIKGTDEIDPAVFVDDDGQAYIYWGGKSAKVAKLDKSLKKIEGDVVNVEGADYFYEAAWMHKLDDTYYLSYSSKFHPDTKDHIIVYGTSDKPMGPFKYQGKMIGDVSGITNHHSTVKFKGQWYAFYHNSDLSGGHNARRSIVADYLHFNDDGSIREVVQTKLGVGQYDGMLLIEAENYSETKNVQKRESKDGSLHLAFDVNEKVVFNNVDFGEKTVNSIKLNVASLTEGGKVMVRTKSGTLLGEVNIPKTKSIDKWKTVSGKITELTGLNSISLTYVGSESSMLRLDSLVFSK